MNIGVLGGVLGKEGFDFIVHQFVHGFYMFLLQISVKKETQQTYKFKAGRIKCTWKFGKKELTRRVSIEDLFPLNHKISQDTNNI